MRSLNEIAEFAKQHKACSRQYKPFVKAIKEGNELLAWQIVVGNLDWLCSEGCELDLLEVEKLAQGVGVGFHLGGQLSYRNTYKNGEPHGTWESWYENGQLSHRYTYKNGERHGVCEGWHSNGQLEYRETYENGKMIKVREEEEEK